jgi:hypothetical protein
MSWVVNNPIAIVAGLLLSAAMLWAASFFADGAREAARSGNDRLVTYTSCYGAVFFSTGALGCLFFAVRFVRWAWYF